MQTEGGAATTEPVLLEAPMSDRAGSRNTAERKNRAHGAWLLLSLLAGCVTDTVPDVDLRLERAAIIDVRLASLSLLPIPDGERRITVLRLDVSLHYRRGVREAGEVSVICSINDVRDLSPPGMSRSARVEGEVDRNSPMWLDGFELFGDHLTPGPDDEGRYPVQVDTLAGIDAKDVASDPDAFDPVRGRLERLLCFAVDNVRSPPSSREPVSNVISISRDELRAMFEARGTQPAAGGQTR